MKLKSFLNGIYLIFHTRAYMDLMGYMRKYTDWVNKEVPQQNINKTTNTMCLKVNPHHPIMPNESKINLQRIAIKKSAMVLELLNFKFEHYRKFLNVNVNKATNLTSMVIEIILTYYNTQNKKENQKTHFVNVKIPIFLMKYLFENSYAKNNNKYCDMCVTINLNLDITVLDEQHRERIKEIYKKKEYLNLLESEDIHFVTNIGYDEILNFYNEIIKKNE